MGGLITFPIHSFPITFLKNLFVFVLLQRKGERTLKCGRAAGAAAVLPLHLVHLISDYSFPYKTCNLEEDPHESSSLVNSIMKRRKFSSSARKSDVNQSNDDFNDDDDGPLAKKRKPLTGKVVKGSFEHRFERRRYLKQLVNEFETTTSSECRQQVLANLANFAYDSYNYNFFQEIGVIPIFLAEISVNRDETLSDFAMAGVCNCAADKRMQKEILKLDGLKYVTRLIYSDSVDTRLSAITTLIYFLSDDDLNGQFVKDLILKDSTLTDHLNEALSNHEDRRLRNVTQVLLEKLK